MNLHELTARLHAIRDRNDWRQFHSPKNLAMAASVEMAELVEIFQWLTEEQSRTLPADQLEHAGQALAEPALPMLDGARQRFAEAGQAAEFIQAPWQELPGQLSEPYDLVLCHAVLEWLAEPHAILPVLHRLCAPGGWLSLAFYNRDALIYRNLLKGHFRKLRKERFAGEGRSLTPQRPLDPRELEQALETRWRIEARSGVRVFHDYMPSEFQAKAEPLDLVEMELAYRRHPAFAGLGRYLHWLCRPQ